MKPIEQTKFDYYEGKLIPISTKRIGIFTAMMELTVSGG